MPEYTRSMNLTITAEEEELAEEKVDQIISAIHESDALPTDVVASRPVIHEDFRDDMGDVADADHVEVRWRARDERGRILHDSDDVFSAEQAVAMFRGIGEVTP